MASTVLLSQEMNISLAAFSFSFVQGMSLPFLLRSFAQRSLVFSAFVPRNRCAGFTQHRVSHLWQTHMLGGICPTCIS
jgi:hypothetical protein